MRVTVLGIGLAAAAAVVLLASVRLGIGRGPATRDELDRLGLPDGADVRELVGRWRDRTRRWRTTAALPAVVAALAVGLVTRHEVRVGVGGAPLYTDPLTIGLLAAFFATVAAELHHLRRRPRGPRLVSLRPRAVTDHLPRGSRARLVVLAILAGAATLGQLLVPDVDGVPVVGIAALVTAGAIPAVEAAIVTRPRPLLDEALTAADDAVRGLAIRSVDTAGAGIVLLLTLWQATAVATQFPTMQQGPVAFLLGLGFFAVTVLAVVWWWRGAPRRLLLAAGVPSGDRG